MLQPDPLDLQIKIIKKKRSFLYYLRIVFTFFLIAYYVYFAFHPGIFHPLDGAFTIIHEVGHVIASPLSFEAGMLGGTIADFGSILGIMFYFFLKGNYYAVSVSTFFLGSRLSYTSWYIADATKMEGIPFIPWPDGIHDWNWILSQIGQLHNADNIGLVVWIFALEITGIAILSTLWFAVRKKEIIQI